MCRKKGITHFLKEKVDWTQVQGKYRGGDVLNSGIIFFIRIIHKKRSFILEKFKTRIKFRKRHEQKKYPMVGLDSS